MCSVNVKKSPSKIWNSGSTTPLERRRDSGRRIQMKFNSLSSSLSWWTWFRYIQKAMYLSIITSLLGLIITLTYSEIRRHSNQDIMSHPVPNFDIFNRIDWYSKPPSNVLLDLNDFRLLRSPVNALPEQDYLFFLVVIHSKPNHFRQRQMIRATWGGIKSFKGGEKMRVVFILGIPDNVNIHTPLHLDVMRLIREESQRYGDMVIGNFIDDYKNLSYKHVLGLKWSSSYSSKPSFIVKADDDAFIDLPGLHNFLKRTYDPLPLNPTDVLACNIIPSGTPPLREGKWLVTEKEYPWNEYPQYCAGLAYVMTPDVASQLYALAQSGIIPKLWIDDVWITGIVAAHLQLNTLNLNTRYSYDPQDIVDWLSKASSRTPPPYTFLHLDPTRYDWAKTLQQLWRQITISYNLTSSDYR